MPLSIVCAPLPTYSQKTSDEGGRSESIVWFVMGSSATVISGRCVASIPDLPERFRRGMKREFSSAGWPKVGGKLV